MPVQDIRSLTINYENQERITCGNESSHSDVIQAKVENLPERYSRTNKHI